VAITGGAITMGARTATIGAMTGGGRTTGMGRRTGLGLGTGGGGVNTRSRSEMISASCRGVNAGFPPAARSSRRFSFERSLATGSRRIGGTVGIGTTVGTRATGPIVGGGACGIVSCGSVSGSTLSISFSRIASLRRLWRSLAMSRERWPGFACGSALGGSPPARIPLT